MSWNVNFVAKDLESACMAIVEQQSKESSYFPLSASNAILDAIRSIKMVEPSYVYSVVTSGHSDNWYSNSVINIQHIKLFPVS